MAGGVQTLIQKYAIPALVGLALTGGAAFVQSQKDAAVRKALTKAYTDSITAVHRADSATAAAREAVYEATLAASARARQHDLQHAAQSEAKADSLQTLLTAATTPSDSITLLVAQHVQDTSTIADLHRAIVHFVADSVTRDAREQDLRNQLASANHTIATLIVRVNQDAKQGFFASTPVKLGEAVLAGYGVVKLGQAAHLIP